MFLIFANILEECHDFIVYNQHLIGYKMSLRIIKIEVYQTAGVVRL